MWLQKKLSIIEGLDFSKSILIYYSYSNMNIEELLFAVIIPPAHTSSDPFLMWTEKGGKIHSSCSEQKCTVNFNQS